MSKYVMISYYNRGTNDDPIWEVYVVEREHHPTCVGTFKTEIEALEFAHKDFPFILPVMRGHLNGIEQANVLKKLSHVREA